MPYGLNHGVGSLTPTEYAACNGMPYRGIFNAYCWQSVEQLPANVAPVGAPTGDALTVPPASGEDAQATVDALVNQQMRDQQALDAAVVKSGPGWIDEAMGEVYSGASSAASGLTSALPWILGALGLGVFALVAVGGGGPRRYGR